MLEAELTILAYTLLAMVLVGVPLMGYILIKISRGMKRW